MYRWRLRELPALPACAGGLLEQPAEGAALQAERDNPPRGRFLDLHGVRLHYLERGDGPVLVLLHGNGSMIEDFVGTRGRKYADITEKVIV